jgi:enolase
MQAIKRITCRRVLNSHVEFTNEFVVELEDGSIGMAASPKGETVSVYEDRKTAVSPQGIISALEEEGCIGPEVDQSEFDGCLEQHINEFGRNNACSLSLAFFNATTAYQSAFDLWNKSADVQIPCLCLNILNGGRHAYTNPVLSDFSEYLLVSKSNRIEDAIQLHHQIQRRVREKLQRRPVQMIADNPVHCFSTADNRECIEFLLEVREELGLASQFDLMIDASAGDLWTGKGYQLALTDKSNYSPDEFRDYWLGLLKEYDFGFLEDPFREHDVSPWQQLTASAQRCRVIGDNFYSSDADRIEKGASSHCTHGVIIKPNQAGTVTSVRRALEVAQDRGQIVITSHRSISTEETFISTLTCLYQVKYIKIGPLFTDYSSVVRLNAILRLAEGPSYVARDQDKHNPARVHGI